MWDSIATDSCGSCQCPPRSNRTRDPFMDKENFSPMKSDELSFYGSNSPTTAMCTGTSPNHCFHNTRRPLEDYDPNSRDSGYIGAYISENGKLSPTSRGFSFESGSGSMESDFYEALYEIEPIEDNLPEDFDKLLNGQMFQTKPAAPAKSVSPRDCKRNRPPLCRALSLQNEKTTPNSSRVRSCLFKPITGELRPFKRPDPPMEQGSPVNSKKARFGDDDDEAMLGVDEVTARPVLQRPFSATEESIKWAVHKSSTEPDLIGDFSKTYSLPLTPGRHQDLKAITSKTLAHLLQGEFESNIGTFKVIDCRYPYEFDGGHIDGAVNVYTKDQCMELLNGFKTPKDAPHKRHILVFHCEFSSERAPSLYRYLREQDRQLNQEAYPSLHFPEIYLLEGGYKNFFEQFKRFCVPVAYKEMLHPDHGKDLRFFRQMAKSCNLDSRENRKKRLGL